MNNSLATPPLLEITYNSSGSSSSKTALPLCILHIAITQHHNRHVYDPNIRCMITIWLRGARHVLDVYYIWGFSRYTQPLNSHSSF